MITINLLPSEGPGPSKVYVELVFGLLLIAIAAAGIGFYWNYMNGIIQNRHDEIAAKKEQVRKLQYIIDNVKKFEEEKKKLETKLNLIKTLRENQKGPVVLFDQLSRNLPDNVWYSDLDEKMQHLAMTGGALSMMSIGDLLQSLNESEFFNNVRLKKTRMTDFKGRELYVFNVEMDFVEKTPPQPQQEPAGQP